MRCYIINPVLEVAELDEFTINVVSPLDRFTLRDESRLINALFRAAAVKLDVDAFIEQHEADYLAVAIENAVSALVKKELMIAANDDAPLDPFFQMLEYGRTRSGPPLSDHPAFDQPSKWIVAVAGSGVLTSRITASLRTFGFTVEAYDPCALTSDHRPNLVVACAETDDFRSFRTINRATVEAGVPTYYISIDRQIVRAGPLVIPHESACMECYYHRVVSTRRFPTEFISRAEEGRLLQSLQPSKIALEVASAAIDRIIFFATGMATDLHLSPVREHDILRGSSRTSNLLRLPRCPVCSRVAKRPAVQIYTDAVARDGA